MAALGPLTTLDSRRHPGPATGHANDDSLDPVLTSRQRRRARNLHSLSALYRQRDDIQGVSPVADFFVESTSWCA